MGQNPVRIKADRMKPKGTPKPVKLPSMQEKESMVPPKNLFGTKTSKNRTSVK